MPKGLGTAIFTKRIEISVDDKAVEYVKELAWREKLSISAYLRTIIQKEYLQLTTNEIV
jgi:hypothetical protein